MTLLEQSGWVPKSQARYMDVPQENLPGDVGMNEYRHHQSYLRCLLDLSSLLWDHSRSREPIRFQTHSMSMFLHIHYILPMSMHTNSSMHFFVPDTTIKFMEWPLSSFISFKNYLCRFVI